MRIKLLLCHVAPESSFLARIFRLSWERGRDPTWSEEEEIGVEWIDSGNNPLDLGGVAGAVGMFTFKLVIVPKRVFPLRPQNSFSFWLFG
jgi:hypothetical protein